MAFAPPLPTAAPQTGAAVVAPAEAIDFSQWGPIRRQPMSPLRRTISRRMLESWTTLPQVNQFDDADVTVIADLQKKHGPAYAAHGIRLTLTPIILKAIVRALRQHPIFNASLDESTGEIIYKEYYHLGIAVDTEAGLIVPVLRDADRKGIATIAKELHEMAAKAKARKLSAEELKGGTFTISNQGGIGGAHFTPLINKPEVAILGLGRSVFRAVVRHSQIEPRAMLPLCLSYDHRLIDGASAARFMVQIVRDIEDFPENEVAEIA
jgi:pyruvate dehydrogenase E2 component (dihydrolipoamide acetyltransferase)